MSIIKYLVILIFFTILHNQSIAEEVKKIGKFKDWESFVLSKDGVKTCFAQSIPVVKAPKKPTMLEPRHSLKVRINSLSACFFIQNPIKVV